LCTAGLPHHATRYPTKRELRVSTLLIRAKVTATVKRWVSDSGTRLKLTIQIVSSVGEGMIKGFESGNRSALEGLATHLARLTARG
jgi:hypothetical protein